MVWLQFERTEKVTRIILQLLQRYYSENGPSLLILENLQWLGTECVLVA